MPSSGQLSQVYALINAVAILIAVMVGPILCEGFFDSCFENCDSMTGLGNSIWEFLIKINKILEITQLILLES
jgi:hypothetical protein